jgi:hypothetical protein
MAEPTIFSNALVRVKSWKPKFPDKYDPGWKFLKRKTEQDAEAATNEYRKDYLDHMFGMVTLMHDPTYFDAFKVMQDFNLKLDKDRPTKEAYVQAVQTIRRIENEKKIEGLGSLLKESLDSK